jgi:mono/diheme cytochrome c family protein
VNRKFLWTAVGLLTEISAFGQPPRTVLDGVYTDAQAKRGEAAYGKNCAGCHGEDLFGRAMGPLRGEHFLDRWREESLNVLFTHIRTKMPANAAGSLNEATYVDILAYILQVNMFPAGSRELTADAVGETLLVGKDGPQPLATNALVQVVGCMTRNAGEWMLTDSAEPRRTEDAEHSTPEELKNAASRPLGSRTFRLQNLDELADFHPEPLAGHKVQAKGVLVRQTNRDRINVLSVEPLVAVCGQ